ncbi:sugar kinase [Candidatus Woesearchaeota archaeon]|nr:sugar kinase [Candidatus Woesearchaeota archaeon]
MPEVIILGTLALDTIETPFGKQNDILGGSAAFAAYAASFFAKPGIISIVGKDFPAPHKRALEQRGIDLSGVKVEGKTFRWEGFYEFDMNEAKTLKTELNSLAEFVPEIPEPFRDAGYIFLANTDPEIQLGVLEKMKAPGTVILDTMNFWIQHKREALLKVMKKASIVLLNDGEARQMFATPNLVKAAKEVLALGPYAAIIKKGEHGALLFTKDSHFNAPGYPLEEIKDPTGCGDTFGGALIGWLAKAKSRSQETIRKAMIYASVLASFNAEDFSLERLKKLTHKDIESRYQEFVRMRNF